MAIVSFTQTVWYSEGRILDEAAMFNVQERVIGTKVVTGHPDLEITIKRCQMNGQTCVLDFLLVNLGNDVTIELHGTGGSGTSGSHKAKAFDDEGNQYEILVGISGVTGPFISATSLFPTDSPLKCRIQINNMAASATNFNRIYLPITCRAMNFQEKEIVFYNVPITRDGDE